MTERTANAQFYAKQGFAIFPLHTIDGDACSCGKPICRCAGRCETPWAHCASPGKHPIAACAPHGVLEATNDLATIAQWWALFPDANIGLATGDASGIVVIDIDPDHGGELSWDALERRFGEVPPTWAVATGGGGFHLYFAMPDLDIRNSAGAIGAGIDVRGNGGYVVMPPSVHASGNRYRWLPAGHPRTVMLAELPAWLCDRVVPAPIRHAAAAPLPAKIHEGQRNVLLASAAGTMRRRGFSEAAIVAALHVENRQRCDPPLPAGEVERIARSIDRYPPVAERWVRAHGQAAMAS